jgi:transcriptional regulator with XRE-family HTH domain
VTSTAAVTLPRIKYERLLTAVEDAEDQATIALAQAREAQLGKEAARWDHLPIEQVERLLAGESPVRIWREHRGVAAHDLARAALVSLETLSDIEAGKLPLMPDVAALIGTTLDVPPVELGEVSQLRWRERSPLSLHMTPESVFPDEASARAALEALKAFYRWWRAVLRNGSASQLEKQAAAAQERLRSLMAAARKSGG